MAFGLFRAHVAELPFERTGARGFQLAFRFGYSKIHNLYFAFEADHDVLWTHVAMSDVQRLTGARVQTAVSVVETRSDFLDDVNDLIDGKAGRTFFEFV